MIQARTTPTSATVELRRLLELVIRMMTKNANRVGRGINQARLRMNSDINDLERGA